MNRDETQLLLEQLLARLHFDEPLGPSQAIVLSAAECAAVRSARDHLASAHGDDKSTLLPPNAGKPWTDQEDERLRAGFLTGDSPQALARAHQRTTGAIKARLIRLRLVVEDDLLPSIAAPQPATVTPREDTGGDDSVPDSEEHRSLVSKSDYPLGVEGTGVFQPGEVEILRRYGFWLEALAQGRIQPMTPAQEHFCQVCRDEAKPETRYEWAWRRLTGRRAIEPNLRREFQIVDPGEEWFRREAHWRYH